jgi:hypothetical protein
LKDFREKNEEASRMKKHAGKVERTVKKKKAAWHAKEEEWIDSFVIHTEVESILKDITDIVKKKYLKSDFMKEGIREYTLEMESR